MNVPKESAVALWLVPEGDAAEYLQQRIDELATRFGAAAFAVHLTLGLGPATLLEKICSAPFELPITGVAASAEFTKSLFLRCASTPELAALRASLGMSGAGYDPHLSLLYCDLPLEEKRRLARTIDFPYSCVRFTSVAAVRCTLPVATAADVAAWKIIAHRPLRAG